ncbi:MAG: ABC transporter substrate-binding protein [Verrucomicrobiota bacterium]
MKHYPAYGFLVVILLFAGCGGGDETETGLIPIKIQTDWYAQAEHGGFYQAMVEGYYEDVGLDVTIMQGGPNAMEVQKTASQQVQFTLGRSDTTMIYTARDIPIVMVAAFMQHDPQALLFHEESGIDSFEDLDGKTVMIVPGSVFIDVLNSQFGININVIPLDYGMSRFMNDKDFIQQCFITNEPYYAAREGANPKTLLLADTGFDPYRVIYTNSSFARKNPEVVKAFVAASIKGWASYMAGPREKANALIQSLNPKMTDDFLNYSIDTMAENQLIAGRDENEALGLITHARINDQIRMLEESDLLDRPITAEEVAPIAYLPAELQAMSK